MAPRKLTNFMHSSLLVLVTITLHVLHCAAVTSREGHFTRIILCSDALPGTTSIQDVLRTKLGCATRCTEQSTCTAYTFTQGRTCNLHTADVSANTCPTNSTLSVHYKKNIISSAPSYYCLNGGSLINNNTACRCVGGYVGNHCERIMEDCDEGIASGHYPNMDGVYMIHPSASPNPFTTYCHFAVRSFIHQRYFANVSFNVSMANYVSGFGNMNGDFWLGLEKLHLLTTSRYYTLGIQVSNFTNPIYQRYYVHFQVQNASTGYAMNYSSQYLPQSPALPMGDCLTPLKNLPFSAFDNDKDNNSSRNCAADYGGGWWYNSACSECNLVGTLRRFNLTRIPGAVNEVFWNPGLDPTFSPSSTWIFLFRTP